MKYDKKADLVSVKEALKLGTRDLRKALIATMHNAETMHDADALREVTDRIHRVERAVEQLELALEFL
jgi:hypothetical protein